MLRSRRCCGPTWRRGWGESMADVLRASGIAVRAADALLRGASGRTVLLRVPAAGVAGAVNEQLGLTVPGFTEVELGPVVVRGISTKRTRELLVSATSVGTAVQSSGLPGAQALFAAAFGVLVDGVLMEMVSATEDEVGGVPYLYRLTVQVPVEGL